MDTSNTLNNNSGNIVPTFAWTELSYMYRDADNYKQFKPIFLIGRLGDEEINRITERLEDGDFLLPSQLGLENLQPYMGYYDDETDHIWHELCLDELTIYQEENLPTNISFFGTVQDFVARFEEIAEWDFDRAFEELESWKERSDREGLREKYNSMMAAKYEELIGCIQCPYSKDTGNSEEMVE